MKRLNLKKYKDSSYLWKWIWNIYSDDRAESSREGEINKHSAHSKLQNLFILLRRGLSWLSCLCQKNTLTPQLSSLHRRHSITVKKLWVGLCFQQLWFARLSLSLSLSVALIFHFSCTPPPPHLYYPFQGITSSHLKPQVSEARVLVTFLLTHFNWLYLDTSHFLFSV